MRPDWMVLSNIRVQGKQKYHAALKLYPAFLMRPTTQSPLCLNLDWPDTWPDQNVQRRQEILKSAEAESRIAFPGLPGLPARRATLVPIGTFYETHRKSGTPECAMLKSTSGKGPEAPGTAPTP